ncbi:MAG: ATP-dependent DNA helicase RecG [Bacteroidetes bacterium]|nr:MAG: ATP-dependent DNA helicase RecG [Bacteroidota bacterium]
MDQFLNTPIKFVKGVGPAKESSFKTELGIHTLGDLLYYFPFRYIDRSKIYTIREIREDMPFVQIKGKLFNLQTLGSGRSTRLSVTLKDESGQIELVWFAGIKWIREKLIYGKEYLVFGRPTLFNKRFNITHPEIELIDTEKKNVVNIKLQPFYNSSEKLSRRGLDSKGIAKIIYSALKLKSGVITENLPPSLLNKYRFVSREQAIHAIHYPENLKQLESARKRLKLEELFFLQLRLLKQKLIRTEKIKGHIFTKVGEKFNRFYSENLPFELTNAQKKVMREIRVDMSSGKQMNRLLQGDVGSGKTLVALLGMLLAVDNGFQACMMAPTEILAYQHYNGISEFLDGLGIEIELLTGSTKTKKRREIREGLLSGKLNLLIGTHALIEDAVQFKELGFVVIDEQHRFGVAQRAKLWRKSIIPPHILVMTATPIPRTLAMTLYGDLDYSVIDELPPGRKAIKTHHFYDKDRLKVFGFMRQQIKEGRQVYVVYPLIKESEKLDLKDLEDGYESIVRDFPRPKYQVSILHGKMKPADKDFEMARFVNGETQIMVSTTVIEVGVDVPNASVMVIENAERFGLSQLHQLRGRVGRGAEQSYCILMSSYKLTADGKKRLQTMVDTTDGFEIADVDLKLRGPGDMHGTQQSGILDLKIVDLVKDEKILKFAREKAIELLQADPHLELSENKQTALELQKVENKGRNWIEIS